LPKSIYYVSLWSAFQRIPKNICGGTLVSVQANDLKKSILDRHWKCYAYTWLVNHLSWEGDTVVDVGSSTGYAGVAALKEGCNAVWVSTESDDKQQNI